MHDGGPIKSPRARETEVSDANRSILSRSQPGRLWSIAYPVRALRLHADDGFGDAADRGLIPQRGAVPVAALFHGSHPDGPVSGDRGPAAGAGLLVVPVLDHVAERQLDHEADGEVTRDVP